jgi:hypothetical protein
MNFEEAFKDEIEKLGVRYAEKLRAGELSEESKARLGVRSPAGLSEARRGSPAMAALSKDVGRGGLGKLGPGTFETSPGSTSTPGRILEAQTRRREPGWLQTRQPGARFLTPRATKIQAFHQAR